eukprot:29832-Pelagococcus_subviridis.AAC.4
MFVTHALSPSSCSARIVVYACVRPLMNASSLRLNGKGGGISTKSTAFSEAHALMRAASSKSSVLLRSDGLRRTCSKHG